MQLKTQAGQKGFTLIEMAMVIIIVGLAVGSVFSMYGLWLKERELRQTNDRREEIVNALGTYRALHGRYPCPASLTAQRDEAEYGRESDCSDQSILPGNCVNGICIEQSQREITFSSGGTNVTINPRVRVGTVPFRQLNLAESTSRDGYGYRYRYAVTERLTDKELFDNAHGGIGILSASGNSAVTPTDSAHFIVISHGKSGSGAHTIDGVQLPCEPNRPDSQNCAVKTDSVYVVREISTAEDNYYDDTVSYFMTNEVPLWERSDAFNIRPKRPGSVGIGGGPANPVSVAGLEVSGTLRVEDDPSTTAETEGEAQASEICGYSGDVECFSASLIAGDETQGLSCPAGQFMIGIANNLPVCQAEIYASCPSGQYLIGINDDGSLNCDDPPGPPPPGCETQIVGICGGTEILTAGSDRSYQTIEAGASRIQTYQCRDEVWTLTSSSGLCECEEDVYTDRDRACGTGYSGTFTRETRFICPEGWWTAWVTTEDNCECVGASQREQRACPSGFNTGTRYREREFTCPEESWTGWTFVDDTCRCEPDHRERDIACSGGLTGRVFQERHFTCSSPTSPGSWSSWTETHNTCTCETRPESRPRTCPGGYIGEIEEQRTLSCPDGTWSSWTEVSNTCTPPPPVICNWYEKGSAAGGVTEFGSGPRVGDRCDCGATGNCHKRLGSGSNLNFSNCACE